MPETRPAPAGAKGFLFDPNTCTGCQACELACAIENHLVGTSWREVVTLNEARHPGVPVIHLSMACNHCADAPCAEACPANAYTRDPATGRVDLDPGHCIGCRYCSWACPYDAPKFDAPNGVMTKCTFCGHRQDRGLEPACVELCPTGALGFGDLATLPGVREAPGLPTTAPGPSIRFLPWKKTGWDAGGGEAEPWSASRGPQPYPGPRELETPPPSKISLRSEWPLLGFTLLAAAVVAAFTSSVLGSRRLPVLAFLVPALAAMALSSLHLGRKRRAWRAVLNVRRSWLSREVVLYSAFTGLASLSLLLPESELFALAVAFVGFSALFAMDRVYDVVRPAWWYPVESADVVLTGIYLTLVLRGDPFAAFLLGALKLGLYLRRRLRGRPRNRRVGWSGVRIVAGFVFPVVMIALDPERWPAWTIAGTALGEAIDRGQFYDELEVPSPRRSMAWVLERRLSQSRGSRTGAAVE